MSKPVLWASSMLLFALAVAAGLATILFPIIAGILRLGMPGTNVFRALTAWTGYVMGQNQPAHWFTFWTDLKLYLGGQYRYGANDLSALPKTLAMTSGIAAILATGLVVIAIYNRWSQGQDKPQVDRQHLRGARLLAPRDMPAFVAALVAKGIFPNDDRKRRKWQRNLSGIKLDAKGIEALRIDAGKLGRSTDKADVRADAQVDAIGTYAAKNGLVRLGSIPLPPEKEALHALICASTGTGKTVALKRLLGDLRCRGDRVISIDAGYDLSKSFGRDDDLMLSALDPQSLGWDLRNEVRRPSDWRTLMQSVVPATGGGDGAEWARKAQAFLTAICEQVGKEASNAELLKIATSWPPEALAEILNDTEAASYLASGGDRYLVSVRNNLAEKLAGWKYTKAGDFSLTDYMTSDDPRWLWLPYMDRDKGIAGPAIAAWVDMLVLAGLERAHQPNPRKTWIIIDELDSIGTIGSLKDAVTRLRKSNVAIVAAIQDYSQLIERYGRETAQTLFGCFSNRLFLRCTASDLAEKIARELGEAEFEETRTQTARNVNRQSQNRTSRGENTSASAQYVKSQVLLPSQIQQLPDRTGFVKLSGVAQVLPVVLSV